MKHSRFPNTDDELELTNFSDPPYVLVALLAAMVAVAPPALREMQSRLTEADGEQAACGRESAVVLSFSGDREIRWEDELVSLEQLERKVEALAAAPCPDDADKATGIDPPQLGEAVTQNRFASRGQRSCEAPAVFLAGHEGAPYGLSLKIRSILGKHGIKVKELARKREK